MTHSPRIAAMCTNKRYGDDVSKNPALMHRLAWLKRDRDMAKPTHSHTQEQALRERTA